MANSVIDHVRKANAFIKKTSDMLKTNDQFVKNYRAVTNGESTPVTSNFNIDSGRTSNDITFRNAKVGEKTGLQKISLLKSNGDKEDIFLIVPERESVGYGNIRGWGSPDDQNMSLTKQLWETTTENAISPNRTTGAKSFAEGGAAIATPFTVAGDVLAMNTIRNNTNKNEKSNYTGPDKAVGLGESGQSEGQIFGMITSNGEMITPQETKYFLTNLKENGYKGVTDIEQPKKVQEHTGPAYVPGDILLGLLGLQPNRGSVGYTFKTPGANEQYRAFIKNLRKSGRK